MAFKLTKVIAKWLQRFKYKRMFLRTQVAVSKPEEILIQGLNCARKTVWFNFKLDFFYFLKFNMFIVIFAKNNQSGIVESAFHFKGKNKLENRRSYKKKWERQYSGSAKSEFWFMYYYIKLVWSIFIISKNSQYELPFV